MPKLAVSQCNKRWTRVQCFCFTWMPDSQWNQLSSLNDRAVVIDCVSTSWTHMNCLLFTR